MVCIKSKIFWEKHVNFNKSAVNFSTPMKNKLQNGTIINIQSDVHDAVYNYISSCSIIMNSSTADLSSSSEDSGTINLARKAFYLINENGLDSLRTKTLDISQKYFKFYSDRIDEYD